MTPLCGVFRIVKFFSGIPNTSRKQKVSSCRWKLLKYGKQNFRTIGSFGLRPFADRRWVKEKYLGHIFARNAKRTRPSEHWLRSRWKGQAMFSLSTRDPFLHICEKQVLEENY